MSHVPEELLVLLLSVVGELVDSQGVSHIVARVVLSDLALVGIEDLESLVELGLGGVVLLELGQITNEISLWLDDSLCRAYRAIGFLAPEDEHAGEVLSKHC